MNRLDVVQKVIDHCRARNYLEIGVKKGKLFLDVRARKKLAVDPVLKISAKRKRKHWVKNRCNVFNEYYDRCNVFNGYYEMTSDHFFKAASSRLAKLKKIDVAFVDGLHTYEQSLADVKNCLKYLDKNGVILVHDCSPNSEAQACPAASRKEADTMSPDGKTGVWSGDVWKTIAYLRSIHQDLHVFVLDCDHGIGVITHGQPDKILDLSEEKIAALTYQDLDENRDELINLKSPEYLAEFLKQRTAHGLAA